MKEQLEEIQQRALQEIADVQDARTWEELRVQFTGKKSPLSRLAAGMKDLPPEEKPAMGQALNAARNRIQEALEERRKALQEAADRASLEGIDLTLPARTLRQGSLHPLTQIRRQATSILRQLGFSLAQGPEIETEFHCFDALNTPADHPARNEKDTFYLPDGHLLRTHTSSVQIRTMETQPPPLRIISPGSAYRRDEIDATHLSVFHQIEGLYVAQGVSLADLKGTLTLFFHSLFGEQTDIRFRPHFFPFTEPSFEIDIKLQVKGQKPKWIEIAGCGMVDPAVFEAVCRSRGDQLYDPAVVNGFAFGMGLERLAMIRHGIKDIRLLIENDLRFLHQFAGE